MKNQFNYPITIKVIYEKEAKGAPYVAYIPEFDVSSCGKTEEEAIRNSKETLGIVLEEVKQQGKLDEFLEELGLTSGTKSKFNFPKIIIEPFAFPV